MSQDFRQRTLLASEHEEQVWELFHENSKLSRYSEGLSDEEVLQRMSELYESLPYAGYPIIPLPSSPIPLRLCLDEAITTRASTRRFGAGEVSFDQVASLLTYAYGPRREAKHSSLSRAFRVVPSGGGLYPLEIFFYSARVEGLRVGIYHYNPTKNHLRVLREGDASALISQALVEPAIGLEASLILFITAIFERSIFKYADRGYRFILLDAGHVAQNINLVCGALGLGCLNVGGFFDREIDDLLGLDGLTHSTIYMTLIGKRSDDSDSVQL